MEYINYSKAVFDWINLVKCFEEPVIYLYIHFILEGSNVLFNSSRATCYLFTRYGQKSCVGTNCIDYRQWPAGSVSA